MICSLVCDFYHREANDLFADAEALLENLQNDIFARAFIFRMHHGVVQRGVECLAGFTERRHAELFEDAGELRHRHLHALFERLIGGLLGEGPFQIVVDRQKFFYRLGFDLGVEIVFFLLAAFAEVVIFRGQPQIIVMLLRKISLRLIQL